MGVFDGIQTRSKDTTGELQQLLDASAEELRLKTEGHKGVWHFGEEAKWSLDQDDGRLIFTFADGTVAQCLAQIIGTYNSEDRTWLWAWHNRSIEDRLKADALKVKAFGEKKKFAKLTRPKWAGEEYEAWEMAALAVKLCDAQGAYRGPAGATYVFMTFGEVKLGKPGRV